MHRGGLREIHICVDSCDCGSKMEPGPSSDPRGRPSCQGDVAPETRYGSRPEKEKPVELLSELFVNNNIPSR